MPPLTIHLLRHAQAHPGSPDEHRALTPKGRRDAETLGARLREDASFKPVRIIHSGLVRARETAEIVYLAAGLGSLQLEVDENLSPESNVSFAYKQILETDVSLLMVGHQPHLGALSRRLLGTAEPGIEYAFRKCALWSFQRINPDGDWRLISKRMP